MRGVVVRQPGGPDSLVVERDRDFPVPGPDEIAIRIAATAINRADVIQRQGNYAPPPGSSPVLGLECSGWVTEIGERVTMWQVGDEVCALLPAGGYADQVTVDQGHVLPVPEGLSLPEAAALPEAACTVWSSTVMAAGLNRGDRFLIHGGSGGIGTLAIQVAHYLGAWVAATASGDKLARCAELGADLAIDYREQDFAAALQEAGVQADVILDAIGGPYLGRNAGSLAPDGRLVIIGVQGGSAGELDLRPLIRRRASIHLLSLRGRTNDQKRQIVTEIRTRLLPSIASRDIRPIVDRTFDIEDVVAAHEYFDRGVHVGKVVLETGQ